MKRNLPSVPSSSSKNLSHPNRELPATPTPIPSSRSQTLSDYLKQPASPPARQTAGSKQEPNLRCCHHPPFLRCPCLPTTAFSQMAVLPVMILSQMSPPLAMINNPLTPFPPIPRLWPPRHPLPVAFQAAAPAGR